MNGIESIGIGLLSLTLLLLAVVFVSGRPLSWWYNNFIHPVFISSFLSPVVNYGIYYFRKLFLRQTEKQAMGEHYASYLNEKNRLKRMKEQPNIAVVNKNKDKYTETFIARNVNELREAGYYVHQMYGGYFPTREVHYGHLLSDNDFLRDLVALWEKIRNKQEGHYLRKQFKKYLKNNNIKLVCAEFGTCAAEIYDECQKAGMPIIVTFWGYDIHKGSIVNKNAEKYRRMLATASHIIGVSQDIINKLKEEFHVPVSKLTYLPSTLNLELFSYNDHSQNKEPIFLYVGRFAATKSPHLVIMAFHEVLKRIPEARLVMIGKDEGNDFFEACHILAKALGIEDQIEFKGILPPDQVYDEMVKARVFVQHSLTTPLEGEKEGTPCSVGEAMLAGLPVVATRHAGIAELIEDGQTGVLVDEYDYQGMAQKMIELCSSDQLVQELGKNASDSLRNNPLMTQNTEKLTQIIEQHRLP